MGHPHIDLGELFIREHFMIGYGLVLMMAVVMYMAMRVGVDSPPPILAAIRVKKQR